MSTGRPPTGPILETALYVRDLDIAVAFYGEILGFDLFFQDRRMAALGVPGAGVLLLFRHGASSQPSQVPGGSVPGHDGRGTLHVAFAIARHDLAAWDCYLKERGLEIESKVSWPRGGTSLYFRDPDGHSIELATPGLWPNY